MNFAGKIKELIARNTQFAENASPETRARIEAENVQLRNELERHNKMNNGTDDESDIQHFSSGNNTQSQPSHVMRERVIQELSNVSCDKLVFSSDAAIAPRDTAHPSPVRTAELAESWSDAFLSEINVQAVEEDKGSVLYIGPTDPLARTGGAGGRRLPLDAASMKPRFYHCQQVNFDTCLTYDDLDRCATLENYPQILRSAVDRRRNLDRLLIGFNGTHYAPVSDPETWPNREDCGMGWLEKYRTEAAERVISGLSVGSRERMTAGTHGTLDALVLDGWGAVIDDRWHNGLVAVCNRDLLHQKYFPMINNLDTSRASSETLVNQEMIKNPVLGNLPAVTAPFFPKNAVLVTSLKNLSLYWLKNSVRKLVKDEPYHNRLAFYESWKEDYVVENYEAGCLIDAIVWK